MLLPYQKVDLKIYEKIKSLGPSGLTIVCLMAVLRHSKMPSLFWR